MAHTHPGNAGDIVKHVVLFDALSRIGDRFDRVRHFDFFSGEGVYRNIPSGTPLANDEKRRTFETLQPRAPSWYAGSPLVAMAALRGKRAEIRLSDEDPEAVANLKAAIATRALGTEPWPDAWQFRGEIEAKHRRFVPRELTQELLADPRSVNTVLLDPTYKDGYRESVIETVKVLRESTVDAMLICWEVVAWGIADVLRDEGLRVERARLERYAISIAGLGQSEHEIQSIASEAALGWGH